VCSGLSMFALPHSRSNRQPCAVSPAIRTLLTPAWRTRNAIPASAAGSRRPLCLRKPGEEGATNLPLPASRASHRQNANGWLRARVSRSAGGYRVRATGRRP
jgi:hypothetical protein